MLKFFPVAPHLPQYTGPIWVHLRLESRVCWNEWIQRPQVPFRAWPALLPTVGFGRRGEDDGALSPLLKEHKTKWYLTHWWWANVIFEHHHYYRLLFFPLIHCPTFSLFVDENSPKCIYFNYSKYKILKGVKGVAMIHRKKRKGLVNMHR